jgi:hypothetical protein
MVPNAGLAIVTNRLISAGTEPKYVDSGVGTTDPAVGNTGLETPNGEDRVAGTSSRVTTNATNDTYQVVGTITYATAGAITEVGLFDASINGNLFLRGTFAAINVAIGDKIEFTIKAVFDQA